MAGLFGSNYNDTKAMMDDLSNITEMYSKAAPSNDESIMKAPKSDNVDAGSWWAWLSGLTQQKTQENLKRVQEELGGMDLSGTSPDYQRSMLEGIKQAQSYRDKWAITQSRTGQNVWLEEQGDFIIPEQPEITVEPLDSEPMVSMDQSLMAPAGEPSPEMISYGDKPVQDPVVRRGIMRPPEETMEVDTSEATKVIEQSKSNEEILDVSTKSVVSSLPPEQAETLMTNPIKWIYDQNLMGLSETTEEGQKAIVGFFNNSLGKSDSEYRTAADVATKGGYAVNTTEGAWCATFVDHVLTNLGAPRLEGRQNYNRIGAARYAKIGKGVKLADAKAGDIAVLSSHVGFVVGKEEGIATSDKGNAKALQAGLTKAGFDAGGVDGIWGPNSSKALAEYQKAKGLEITGNVTPETYKAITGKDGKVTTNVLILGGNQDNSVNVTSYPASKINHYRRIDSIKDLDTDTFKAVTKDIRQAGSTR